MSSPPKPLVVVIDIDDDISEVLGVSIVKGEDEVLKAALTYSQERPEDADLNAIFTGLSLYRKLKLRAKDVDIAVVGGDRRDVIEAQVKVKERVRDIVKSYGVPVELYIVGDGLDEIMVAEVLGDVAPIAAVKRVIVEQHAGVETSYALLLRYVRKALEDPRYSRYALGIPGFILSITALLLLFNLISIAIKIALLLLGFAMVVKGFNLEDRVARLTSRVWEELRETAHIKLASLTLLIVLVVGGALITYYIYITAGLGNALVTLLGLGIPLGLIGATLYILLGNVVTEAVKGDLKVLSSIAVAIILIFSSAAFHSLGSSLDQELLDKGVTVPEAIINALLYSRFIPNIVLGVALAGLIELVMRIIK